MFSLRSLPVMPPLAVLGDKFSKYASVPVVTPAYTRKRPQILALLIDVSGNLHIGSEPTPGAVDALKRLVDKGFPFRLCSNTSKESTADLIKRLDKLGFGISDAENAGSQGGDMESDRKLRLVWTSIGAVAQALNDIQAKTPYLILSDSARVEVLNALRPVGEDTTGDIKDGDNISYDSVVIGLAPALFDYEHLNTAFRILKGEMSSNTDTVQCPPWLIATHRAKYVQSSAGKLSLGPGPFVAALENAVGSNIRVQTVGKPELAFFEMVIKDFEELETSNELEGKELRPRIAVIGDDVEADLGGGALDLGLWRVLVKTGKYRPGDELRPGVVPPDEVYDSFASFVDSLLGGHRN